MLLIFQSKYAGIIFRVTILGIAIEGKENANFRRTSVDQDNLHTLHVFFGRGYQMKWFFHRELNVKVQLRLIGHQ